MRSYLKSQNGYTLLEVIITVALGAVLMSALTSVVFTANQAVTTATSRVEASSQIRSFEYFAYDDFAASGAPAADACPCTTQPLVLSGWQATSSGSVSRYKVTYTWDGSNFLNRQVGAGTPRPVAGSVSAFTWSVDPNGAVLISMTVTVLAYSQSQTFRFYPRIR